MKTILWSLAVAAVGILLLARPAKAQFRPCVWPNVCKNAAPLIPPCQPGVLCLR